METREAILSRRSIRSYQDRAISDLDLKDIMECGIYAPSAVDFQPWYFVVIRSKEKMASLYQIMARVSEKMEPALWDRFGKHPAVVEESTRFLRSLGGAPACVLAFQHKLEYPKTRESIIESVAAAIENILLAATDKGIGSCWLTAPLETRLEDDIRAAFAPEAGPLLAVITLGYPEQIPKVPARKSGRYILV